MTRVEVPSNDPRACHYKARLPLDIAASSRYYVTSPCNPQHRAESAVRGRPVNTRWSTIQISWRTNYAFVKWPHFAEKSASLVTTNRLCALSTMGWNMHDAVIRKQNYFSRASVRIHSLCGFWKLPQNGKVLPVFSVTVSISTFWWLGLYITCLCTVWAVSQNISQKRWMFVENSLSKSTWQLCTYPILGSS